MNIDDSLQNEFDTHARWTSEAIRELGSEYAMPAACRGSGSPAALRWLAAPLRPGAVLIDVGGGMGGPAAFAAAEVGVRPIVVEPMAGACRVAAELFELPAVVADGEALPFADGAAGAVWCLGVLCTTDRQQELLAELRRVLAPEAPLGLLVFVRRGDLTASPQGNHFPTEDELDRLLAAAGLTVVDRTGLAALGEPPPAWQRAVSHVDDVIEHRHGHDARLADALDQQRRIGSLLADGRVAGLLLHARRAEGGDRPEGGGESLR